MWAIIGGSGFEKFDGFEVIENLSEETPFGRTSSGLKRVQVGDVECLFLSRHGSHHEILPSEINFRANVYALKKYGATAILSFSAIGSLKKELKPGDMVVPTQYIDRTKSLRNHTFGGEGVVIHCSLAKPVPQRLVEELKQLSRDKDWESHFDKTYVCIEGPNFSTQAESNMYRQMGADIIGMTNYPEFALAREAGLAYLPCCFVTDYDCWDDAIPHVTLPQVIEIMRNNNGKAFLLAKDVVKMSAETVSECGIIDQGLRTGLMTPIERVPEKHREWLAVLLS
ncbi:MAG: MTAP family purine nucleoside phosphorylase [Pseudobdellovibrionaceae bacterium]|nr:MTAP family purine nucleoside phosphorylase [Bdellovibrionales bacterium]USN47376.1 MAG: MTAP family purine nucleoside phosphorylase [Pseudobdellovibrionaceae bacterium]